MKFVAAPTWPSIRRVTREKGRHWVAVPYISAGATKRQPLRKGDVLITRFDDETIRAGQADPKEIVRYIKHGVEVHNEPHLHAKVYVSPISAVICSANVSATSESYLLEAGMVITHRVAVQGPRRFVQELRGSVIGLNYAKRKIKLFQVNGGGRGRGRREADKAPGRHALWIVSLSISTWTAQAEAAIKEVKSKAKAYMKDDEAFLLEAFTFYVKFPGRIGDYGIQVVKDGRRTWVEAPGQILGIESYASSEGSSLGIVVEMRKRIRQRTLSQMDSAVSPVTSKRFPRASAFRLVKNAPLRNAILSQWPQVAETNVAR